MNWVFDSHFAEDPVMPGTMLIEGLLQLAGFFGAYVGERGKGRAARVDEVKFLAEVTPADEEILYRIDVRKHNSRSEAVTRRRQSDRSRQRASNGWKSAAHRLAG